MKKSYTSNLALSFTKCKSFMFYNIVSKSELINSRE